MKKAPLCSVLLLLLLAGSTGCSRYYWSKPGATAEQFTQDNQACVHQAAGTLPAGAASLDAVRQYYRACLNSRGYVRDKQLDPPPPGSYRGIENSEEFNAAAQASMAQTPPQGFEQQLAQLDDLKARGRITEDEYATMRKRLVEGGTPRRPHPRPRFRRRLRPPRPHPVPGRPLVRGRSLRPRHPGRRAAARLGLGAGDRSPDHAGEGRRVRRRKPGFARRPRHRLRPGHLHAELRVLAHLGWARAARHLDRPEQRAPWRGVQTRAALSRSIC